MYATADLRHQETTAFRLEIDDQRLLDFRIQATTIDRFPSSSCAGGCRQTAAQGQGNRERACLIAMITLPLLRVRTGMHSVQPVAISVSTIVCTKLPDQDVPECAQQSRAADLSNRRGAGLHRAANCRTHSCPAALAAASDDADLSRSEASHNTMSASRTSLP
ncbi:MULTISPECIES: hypothetical protein [Mesorhizobium]|uniref:hypothetical protein n=1 Tax=Mesorhizobium TaxID=68287 RepID=UPI0013E0B317|nr:MULTISPECIES: hypothetical protein [Mesorhizobium]MCF6102600.1 hypothetical protein [Mesorhizobium muleiense]